jgi:hypothetical protein
MKYGMAAAVVQLSRNFQRDISNLFGKVYNFHNCAAVSLGDRRQCVTATWNHNFLHITYKYELPERSPASRRDTTMRNFIITDQPEIFILHLF